MLYVGRLTMRNPNGATCKSAHVHGGIHYVANGAEKSKVAVLESRTEITPSGRIKENA